MLTLAKAGPDLPKYLIQECEIFEDRWLQRVGVRCKKDEKVGRDTERAEPEEGNGQSRTVIGWWWLTGNRARLEIKVCVCEYEACLNLSPNFLAIGGWKMFDEKK